MEENKNKQKRGRGRHKVGVKWTPRMSQRSLKRNPNLNVIIVDSECRRFNGRRHSDVVVAHGDIRVELEELGHVVHEGEGDDRSDVVGRRPTVRHRGERVADGQIALDGDGQRRVDRAGQRNLEIFLSRFYYY